ncbi:MAG: hypothetical protein ACYTDW_20640 [Planctomycetota bacterium]|jgi:hypothetical protein
MSLSDSGNIADLIPDGCVGYTDMMMLTYKWLYEAVLLAEDLDRDGSISQILPLLPTIGRGHLILRAIPFLPMAPQASI